MTQQAHLIDMTQAVQANDEQGAVEVGAHGPHILRITQEEAV